MTTVTMPANYYQLAPGSEYIVLENKAVPIKGLSGERSGNCFFPHGGSKGYVVRLRRETGPEAMARISRQKATAPVVTHCGLDASDWK